jgi:hypothetical protein
MGNTPSASDFAPTSILECQTAVTDDHDARFDYQCTQSSQVRNALTVIHLIIILLVNTGALGAYTIYNRLVARRLEGQLRALPAKRLPVGRDVVSKGMHRQLLDGFARIVSDAVFIDTGATALPASAGAGGGAGHAGSGGPAGAQPAALRGWGAPGSDYEGMHFREAMRQLGDDFGAGVAAALPLEWARSGASLRVCAPAMMDHFALSAPELLALVTMVEKALYTDCEFSLDEYGMARDTARDILHAMTVAMAGRTAAGAGTDVDADDDALDSGAGGGEGFGGAQGTDIASAADHFAGQLVHTGLAAGPGRPSMRVAF